MSSRQCTISLTFLSIFFFTQFALAKDNSKARPKVDTPPSATSMMMPMTAPLFMENGEFSSTLYMVNGLTVPASVMVTLFDVDGNTISQNQIDFAPDTQKELSIRKMLDEAHSSVTFGSLRLESMNDQGVGVLAQLAITHHGVKDSYFEEELAMPSSSGSQTLRAVGDGTGENSILAINSLAMNGEQNITITGVTENGVTTKKIKLAANQTRIVRPCTETRGDRFDGSVTIDFRGQDKDANRNRTAACGVSIQTDGMPGELAAYGFVHHADDDSDGYFSALTFADPKMLNSSGFVYTGVPVGSAKMLPRADYRTRLVLANFGVQDAKVTVQYASTSHGDSGGKTMAPLLIPALSTKVVEFSNLTGNENLQNSFIVRSSVQPGVVVSKLLSFSDGTLREVEIIGKDEKQMENMGNHPWTIEDGVDSTLILFNHSGASQTFFVKIADQGKQKDAWRKDYKLASMETLAISLNDLIANGVKDDKGNVLSKDAKEGELVWLVPGSSEVTGRILQSDKILNMARNYSCGTCGFLCHDLGLSPDSSLSTGIGFTGDLGDITPQYCNMPCTVPTSCPAYSNPTMAGSASYTWSGGGTVASLVSGGSSTTSTWQGSTTGFTTVTYSIKMTPSAPYACQGSGNISVASASIDSIRSTGTVSTDNAGKTAYDTSSGGLNLGPYTACLLGAELKASVTPSTYTGSVTLQRKITSWGCYSGSTSISCGTGTPPFPDNSDPSLLDTDPQSGGSAGHVYDLDSPGVNGSGVPTGQTRRLRVNFQEFAIDSNGDVISPNFNWFADVSCQNVSGTVSFLNDVSGDNQIGTGSTKTTWNLQ